MANHEKFDRQQVIDKIVPLEQMIEDVFTHYPF